MRCPACRSEDCRVVDTRQRVDYRHRKRVCAACGHQFSTTEVLGLVHGPLQHLSPTVQKKNGKIVRFERDKLMQSLSVAVRKSRRADVPINDLVARIEQEVAEAMGEPVSTAEIGRMAIAALREHDRMAYVRYLSVHQEMESEGDIRALINELQRLLSSDDAPWSAGTPSAPPPAPPESPVSPESSQGDNRCSSGAAAQAGTPALQGGISEGAGGGAGGAN